MCADAAPYRITWVVNAELVPGANITVGIVEIDAGMSNPLHVHPNCEEVLHLLAGTLDHRIGADVVSIDPGDTIHVPLGVPHRATNTGSETARMIVAYPTGTREMVVVEDN